MNNTTDQAEAGETVVRPSSQDELRRWLLENARGDRIPIVPVGGRCALNLGYEPQHSFLLSTEAISGTIDFPARDMTVTVEAGCRVADLAGTLAEENQQLPVDVPLPERATVGGMIAVSPSGSRRYGYRTLRDYVIGVTAVDAQGRQFHAGGRVVKNVAGYDLCKLLTGSLGTLAVVTEVTFKLRPLPAASALLWCTFLNFEVIDRALERLITSAARPVAIEVLDQKAAQQIVEAAKGDTPCDACVLGVGVEGRLDDVASQIKALRKELAVFEPVEAVEVSGDRLQVLYRVLTEFAAGGASPVTVRAGLLSSGVCAFMRLTADAGLTVVAHAADGIVDAQFPLDIDADTARELLASLREAVRQYHGNVIITNCMSQWKSSLDLWGPPAGSWRLMRQLKQQLDPHDLLNRGRLAGILCEASQP